MNNTYSTVSLNRDTHKTRLCADQLAKCNQRLTNSDFYSVSSRSSGLVFTNSVFTATLWSVTTLNNENQLYLINAHEAPGHGRC